MHAMTRPPVYLVAPGALAPSLREALPEAEAVSLPSLEALRPLAEREPGVVVIERDAFGPGDVLAFAEEAAGLEGSWMVLLAREGAAGLDVRPLTVGWPTPLPELARWAASGGDEGIVLELRAVLARVARARHDINNPLTSGMAETQLLLLDAPPEGELRDALETIQAQLRRIRDMVADLRALRPPD